MTASAVQVDGRAGTVVAYDHAGGNAPAVVLVHGINMDASVWSGVVERLAPDRRVVTIDLRGHGAAAMTGPYDADGYADDVIAAMDALGIDRAHLVGTSFGGAVVCTVAARLPERVASVTAIGSAVSVAGAIDVEAGIAALRAAGAREFFGGFMPQASFAPGTDPALIERAVEIAASRDVDVIADIVRAAFTADASVAVAGVRAPALVVTGEHDMTCPVPAGEQLASALGVELTVLPGRGHMAMMEDPDSVVAVLRPHLAAGDAR
ncbi:MAG TPA: alpha/beta fold hydrolase [Acidimicrobiia bacterium]